MTRVAYIDGWRGMAIACVLVGHFLALPGANFGALGVELFFVLSGRLMAEILFVHHPPLGTFLQRRVARIWPALWVFVLGAALGSAMFDWGRYEVSSLDVAKALTLTINYWDGSPTIHHVWSLCVEFHTYLVLALLAFAVRRWGLNPTWACVVLAVACGINGLVRSTLLDQPYHEVYWRSDVRAASMLWAVAIFLWLRGREPGPWLPIAAGVIGVMLQFEFVPDPIKYSAGTIMLATSITVLGSAYKPALAILCHPLVTGLGLISYSVYLWQQPFAKLGGLVWLPAVLAIAYVSYRLIERPAREFINSLALIQGRRSAGRSW